MLFTTERSYLVIRNPAAMTAAAASQSVPANHPAPVAELNLVCRALLSGLVSLEGDAL